MAEYRFGRRSPRPTLTLHPADVVVVDCMLEGVLVRLGREIVAPIVVLVHGLFRSVLPVRDSLVEFGNQSPVERRTTGSSTPASSNGRPKDLVVVTTVPEFDGVDDGLAPNIRYVGPVLPRRDSVGGWPSPWGGN